MIVRYGVMIVGFIGGGKITSYEVSKLENILNINKL